MVKEKLREINGTKVLYTLFILAMMVTPLFLGGRQIGAAETKINTVVGAVEKMDRRQEAYEQALTSVISKQERFEGMISERTRLTLIDVRDIKKDMRTLLENLELADGNR